MYVLGEVGGVLLGNSWTRGASLESKGLDCMAHADTLRYQGVAFDCVAIKTPALCCVVAICVRIKD